MSFSRDDKIQIVYAPGTWGNTLRWLFDRFTKGSKFQSVDSPWDKYGRSHGFRDEDFNDKFGRAHQLAGRYDSPDPDASYVVLSFGKNDLIFVERCGFYRNPGMETYKQRYEQIVKQADRTFVREAFGKTSSKCVAKELLKIQFHDLNNHQWWNSMKHFINNDQHCRFKLSSMFTEDTLVRELESVAVQLGIDFEIDSQVITNVVEKIKDSHVVQTKDRAIKILNAISTNTEMSCHNLDIVEQAFIESELEKIHDCVLFPYGVNWFENTSDIKDFIETYPKYLKHMNPRLPWYNNIGNPYYLKGKIDAE
jgi:hypothetical protein